MHIFISEKRKGDTFYITDEELRHLKVRRISKGETIGVIWEGKLYSCVLVDNRKSEALCEIIEEVHVEVPEVHITLYQSVPLELKTFELIVQKSTELGVRKVIPVITGRSFRNKEVLYKKKERWRKVSLEAMKQSGRPYKLEIEDVVDINEIEPVHQVNILLDNFHRGAYISELELKTVKDIGIVVGPEGGFSRQEGGLLRDKGFLSVRLKPHVLRAETAAIVSVGIIVNLAGS